MPASTRRYLVLAGAGGVFLAVLALIACAWTKPESRAWSGFFTELRTSPGEARLHIQYLAPLSPASLAGLRTNDEITAVDEIRLTGSAAVTEASRRFRSGTPIQLTVLRAGQSFEVPVTPLDALRNPFLLTGVLLNLITGVAFLAVGMFVFARRPGDTRAMLFVGMSAAFGVTRIVNAGPYHAYALAPMENIAPLTALVCASLLLFPLLLHFLLVFPRTRPVLQLSPGVLGWIYGFPALQLILLGCLVAAATWTLDITDPDPNAVFISAAKRLLSPLTARPVITFIALIALSIVPAVRCLRAARTSLRTRGFKDTLTGHPAIVTGCLLFPPLLAASIIGLAAQLTGYRNITLAAMIGFALFPAACLAASILAQTLIFPLAACIAFYRSYRAAGVEERQQMRWPLWGLITAITAHFLVAPAAFLLIAALRLDEAGVTRAIVYHIAQYAQVLCLLLIPLSFAFAILKHRLMDIQLYIRRTVIYGGVSGLLGLFYLSLVGGLGALLSQWTGARNEWWTAFSTLLVAGAFVPVRNRVQSVVDARFFRIRDYSAALQSLAHDIAAARNAKSLAEAAAERLHTALQCRFVEVFLNEGATLRSAAKTGEGREAERVAITHRQSLLGAISLGARLSDEAYQPGDIEFVRTAAGHIAASLENLRLEREQRDLEKAREIQEGLLPSSIPEVPGFDIAAAYQPARSVGGDYYDVIPLGNEKTAFVVADVSGKGLPAALLMSNLQAAVKAFAHEHESPSEISARVNRLICGNVTPGRYITFFYAVLDLRERRLSYTNAGHNPPILHRASGDVLRLDTGGPILGFLRDIKYDSGDIQLHTGDRLLIFTDGVSEAFGPDDEEFGDDRLIAILRETTESAASLKTAVIGQVTEFCSGNFHDDATLIALYVQPEAAQSASSTH